MAHQQPQTSLMPRVRTRHRAGLLSPYTMLLYQPRTLLLGPQQSGRRIKVSLLLTYLVWSGLNDFSVEPRQKKHFKGGLDLGCTILGKHAIYDNSWITQWLAINKYKSSLATDTEITGLHSPREKAHPGMPSSTKSTYSVHFGSFHTCLDREKLFLIQFLAALSVVHSSCLCLHHSRCALHQPRPHLLWLDIHLLSLRIVWFLTGLSLSTCPFGPVRHRCYIVLSGNCNTLSTKIAII